MDVKSKIFDKEGVEVFQSAQARYLHFGSRVIQSAMVLDDPYALYMEYNRLMILAMLLTPTPKRTLFLGLGGGSLPNFVWKHFPECQIDVIEINPVVIEAAKAHFNVKEDERYHIYQQDAFVFLQDCPEKYDAIFVDLYLSTSQADCIGNENFFYLCCNALNSAGALSWNCWHRTFPLFIAQFDAAFKSKTLLLRTHESPNLILLANKSFFPEDSEIQERFDASIKDYKQELQQLFLSLKYYREHYL